MEFWAVIVNVLSGLAVCIPLAIKLVEYVRKATKEKNWNYLLELIMKYMEQAEEKFTNGSDRKQWVLAMVRASADTINYDIDMNAIGTMVDNLCAMSKKVNAVNKETEVGVL